MSRGAGLHGGGTATGPYQVLPELREEEYRALRADIARRGVQVPVEVDEAGHVLDGHHRAAIAQELGLSYPTITRSFATDREKREHAVLLNLARRHLDPIQWGQAFAALLELRGVQRGQGKRNDRTSANVAEVARSVGLPERTARRYLTQWDAYQALPAPAQARVDAGVPLPQVVRETRRQERATRPALCVPASPEVVTSGPVRLYPGDCRAVLPTLPERSVDLIVTSPPYGVGWDYADGGACDTLTVDALHALLADVLAGCYRVLRAGGVLALNLPPTIRTNQERAHPLGAWCAEHLRATGWLLREPVVWEKVGTEDGDAAPLAGGVAIGSPSNPYLRYCHELVLLASKESYAMPGERTWPAGYLEVLKDIWRLPPGRCPGPGEPLAFPDELVRRLVLLFSGPGEVVLDPFAGTGTVGRVAADLGRHAWLIERTPAYWPRLEALATADREVAA